MAKNVTAPRKWKSSPDHPSAQLAYVTQQEIDLLVDANIYGSMDGKPNRGPKGIISLQGDIGGYKPPSSKPSQSSGSSGFNIHGGQPPQVPAPVVNKTPPWVADTPVVSAPSVKTGILNTNVFTPGSSDDPFNEKGDYIDWDAINQQTGQTIGQSLVPTQAEINAAANKRKRIKAATNLSSAIGASGTTQQELEYMLSHNTMSTKMAVQLGIAKPVIDPITKKPTGSYIDTKTGKPYVPKDYGFSSDILTTAGGEAVEDWKEGVLGDIQTAQDYGVYGGVAGIEAEMNKQKGDVVNSIKGMMSEGLSPEEIKAKLKTNPNFRSLVTQFRGDIDSALLNTVGVRGMLPTDKGGIGFWDDKKFAEFQANPTQSWGDVGYDPTGVHTWSDIESTAGEPGGLYEKYLGAGTNWDDPLSGIFAPEKSIPEGGQDYGYGYRNRYGRGAYDRKMALLRALRKGSPIKQLEKSGFMASMKDPYASEMIETGEKGIFSKTTLAGLKPKDMQRLIKSWGSGYTNPKTANVAARGGIMSAWNNMRR